MALLALQRMVEFALAFVNRRHTESFRGRLPDALKGVVDDATHGRSIDYTVAKSRWGEIESWTGLAVLLIALMTGLFAASFRWWNDALGRSLASHAAWILVVPTVLGLVSLPFDWHGQFRIEEKFGFNTSTQKTWWMDRLKGLLIGGAIGFPLVWLVLKWTIWMGSWWWIWAAGAMFAIQLILMVAVPMFILPLFNKFTPLPDGPLRDRLLALGEKTGFNARTILIMDGSRRSRHANAYFTGFGRWRKIVLFDTLIEQLDVSELEAVLAHEIGHYKRGHIPQRILTAGVGLFAGFAGLAWLARSSWFVESFGFTLSDGIAPVLLLFMLLSGAVTGWLSPLSNAWSRKHEYEADAYARDAVGNPEPLITGLRKLTEKNLGNLTPHPWYSAFHYSHPTLVEREAALRRGAAVP